MQLSCLINEDNEIAKAIQFAKNAHAGQTRKFSGKAYIIHPYRVYKRLKSWGVSDKDTLVASILHDTIEDTYASYDTIREEFGKHVADIVKWLSNAGDKNTHIEKLMRSGPEEAILIKTADRIDNLSDNGSDAFLRRYKASTDIIRDGLAARKNSSKIGKAYQEFLKVYNRVY